MITIRPGQERGHVQLSWLDSHHTFSFGSYYDPRHVHFRELRVINEDIIKAGTGFGTHGHQDMEIITYVMSGELTHRDSIGNQAAITAGELQRMTAGTGIQHSEYNLSSDQAVHLLQIWIFPEQQGLEPGYEQKQFSVTEREGKWQLLASRDSREGSLLIHQDVDLLATRLSSGETINYSLLPNRFAWLQVTEGKLTINGHSVEAGDGLAVSQESELVLQAVTDTEVLLFDLA
ncbi:Pirin domain protein [Stanieria cyanosphaera PCC 7437]|uniref:Pirin domain protein n=1 Tax=Stanieria cyanosphaera (strain ATCC 29371 / PCC 7437) TaxID=111780 RepID=K9XQQ0_STAC7|nr:pirin family protein [Stanieria cyanosphaera]AFZ33987.1 Pirin domain protein [Stanieria cyanosphaera PCC 7437]